MFFDAVSSARFGCRVGVTLAMLAAPGLAAAQVQAPATTAAPAKFMIAAIDVSGVTVLPQSEIEQVIYPYMGPDRSTDDVEAARKAVQDAYAKQGYESVQVDIPPQPAQTFAQGIVQIRVTEAAVGSVKVTGAKYHSSKLVREQVASIQQGKPLNLKTLQTDLADANRYPDRQVTPSFLPGKEPGTVDVDLKVKDSLPFHGSVEINNDHSPSTRPLRLIGSLRYTDLWRIGHTISASYIVSPQDRNQTEVFSGAYNAPILGTPWTLTLYGYTSNSDIAALGGSNVLGDGYQIGLRAMYRLPFEKTYQSISFGFDYKHFNQNITVGGQPAGRAPIEYIPISASYSFSSAGDKSTTDITLSATLGLRALKKFGCFSTDPNVTAQNCQIVDQFKNKDLEASENFFHANLDASYNRSWKYDFVTALRLSAQLADSHLVTNEQFAAGGLTNVRGYLQSEAVGDDGFVGSIEFRLPSVASHLPSFVDELRLFGFVDGAKIHVLRTLADQTNHFSLLGIGGGARIRLFNALSGELSVGLPLLDGPTSKSNDLRTLFTAKGEF